MRARPIVVRRIAVTPGCSAVTVSRAHVTNCTTGAVLLVLLSAPAALSSCTVTNYAVHAVCIGGLGCNWMAAVGQGTARTYTQLPCCMCLQYWKPQRLNLQILDTAIEQHS
jgi:hypothetical protein